MFRSPKISNALLNYRSSEAIDIDEISHHGSGVEPAAYASGNNLKHARIGVTTKVLALNEESSTCRCRSHHSSL